MPSRARATARPPSMITLTTASKPAVAIGGFFALAWETLLLIPRRPFALREFFVQSWFVARVSLLPTLMLAMPYTVLVVFTFNILLLEFGAADFCGTTAAFATVTQVGPIVTVLVVAGAGATAMCADLGARTIREELDALRVMGINPVQALVVPRVLAATLVAVLLSSVVITVGLAGGFFFSVFVQHVTPGAYVAGMTVLTGLPDMMLAIIKAALFGWPPRSSPATRASLLVAAQPALATRSTKPSSTHSSRCSRSTSSRPPSV